MTLVAAGAFALVTAKNRRHLAAQNRLTGFADGYEVTVKRADAGSVREALAFVAGLDLPFHLMRKSSRFLPWIHRGDFPRPLHVVPVTGSRYLAATGLVCFRETLTGRR
jgi:hypothetical protein